VNVTGQVLSTFTDVVFASYLLLDSKGHVLVADCSNLHILHILLLSSQLEPQRVLLDYTTSQVKQQRPIQLCYNELASQLYVVHCSHFVVRSSILSLFNLH